MALTRHIPASLKRRIPALRERDALRSEVHDLRNRVGELEERLDHERLFPAEWAKLPELRFMPLVTRQLAISEFREFPMWWLEMIPLSRR